MSKAPSMPMYWDAYLADTTHLTTEEHGAYLLLLGAMWRRNGWVPDNDRDNARILGLTIGKWRKIKARLSVFLMFSDGEITQKNLLKIWENTQEKIDKNRTNGAKGGRPKSNKNKDLAKANGSNSVNPNETIPEPEPLPEDTLLPSGSNGADAPSQPEIVDATKEAIWLRGVPFLIERGVKGKQARSLIGKWLRDAGSEAVFNALAAAKSSGTHDPIPYIEETLKPDPSVSEMVQASMKRIQNAQ